MPWVDIDYARSVVKQMYPGDRWHRRVRDMSDSQVLAIYIDHEGKQKSKVAPAAQPKKEEPNENSEEVFTPDYGEQLSFGGIF